MVDKNYSCSKLFRAAILTFLFMGGHALAAFPGTVEGFEAGWSVWSTDNTNIWQVGVPTYGPATNAAGSRAHAGTSCAATVLGGDYLDDTDGRLVSPQFVVPSAGLNPRLRFWQWFDFGAFDIGEVQISTNNAVTWDNLSMVYGDSGAEDGVWAAHGNGVWSRPCLALSAYAGRTVRIGFHFQSAWWGTASGWYVDEVIVETGAVKTLEPNVPESFEHGLGDWSVESGTWEVGVPTYGPATNSLGQRVYLGMNCAATVLAGDYIENQAQAVSSRLVSPEFVVPSAGLNPRLRFWHWFDFATFDFGEVQISTNRGVTWATISMAYGAVDDGDAVWGAHGNGVWSRPSLALSAYAGRSAQISFHFQSSWFDTAAGWYVDEVTVVTGAVKTLEPNVPESFEHGLGDWSVENGTWEVGVPTYGPATNTLGSRAYGGTNCAATVLAGDSGEDKDQMVSSRLASPEFAVPPAGQSPRLRFWHWYDFGESDFGEVHVSVNNGLTWTNLPVQYVGASMAWTLTSLDLRAYAGRSVQTGFYFNSPYDEVCPGWYVDEACLVVGPPNILVQPHDTTVTVGQSATFCVTQDGLSPLSFSWRFNGVVVTNTSVPSYTITNVLMSQAGSYSVTISSASGSATSSNAVLTVIELPSLSEAVDASDMEWTTGGDAPWLAQFAVTHDGLDAAQSGDIADSQESWMQTTLVGPGTLTYWWKVSSEEGYDELGFYLDGEYRGNAISGEVDWQVETVAIPVGTHILEWRYDKDSSESEGADAAWVDQVSYVAGTPYPQIARQPTNLVARLGGVAQFSVAASGRAPLTYQWRFNGVDRPSATNVSLVLSTVRAADAGVYSVRVANTLGSVVSTDATLSVDSVAPTAPANVVARQVGYQVSLSWRKNTESDLAGYNVYRDGARVNATLLAATNLTETIQSGKAYVYNVTAVDRVGNESVFSSAVTVRLASSAPVITTPNNGAKFVDAGISVRGNAEPAATVQVFVDGVSQGTAVATASGAFSRSGAQLHEGTNRLTAVSVNSYGESSPVSAAVTVTRNARPQAVAGLTGTAGDTVVTLTWRASAESDVRGYRVYRGGSLLTETLLTGTTFRDSRLTNGRAYSYSVKAVDAAGSEGVDATVTATPVAGSQWAIP